MRGHDASGQSLGCISRSAVGHITGPLPCPATALCTPQGGPSTLQRNDTWGNWSAVQGSLPDSLSRLTALEQLAVTGSVHNDGLSGFLPPWAGSLPQGVNVSLDDNAFSGPIPGAWCSSGARVVLKLEITCNLTHPGP